MENLTSHTMEVKRMAAAGIITNEMKCEFFIVLMFLNVWFDFILVLSVYSARKAPNTVKKAPPIINGRTWVQPPIKRETNPTKKKSGAMKSK